MCGLSGTEADFQVFHLILYCTMYMKRRKSQTKSYSAAATVVVWW